MRFTPASILLASALALTASSTLGQQAKAPASNPRAANPHTEVWIEKGRQALATEDVAKARDAYETALLLSPNDQSIYLALAKIARIQKMPGKAIRYYSRILDADPNNQAALQGEGLAMMDKGATESARETLAKLRTVCKTSCASTEPLAAAIAAGAPKVVSADASKSIPKAPTEQKKAPVEQ